MYKVLIAEDEDIIRKGLVYSIDWSDYSCVVVAEVVNGKEGIAAIRKYKPDIVIADINMPIMTGLEMIRETHDEFDYSAIILSGYSSFDYAQKAIGLGVVGYLSKPLDIDELKEVILRSKKDLEFKSLIHKNLVGKNELKGINLFRNTKNHKYEHYIVDEMLKYIYEHYGEKIIMKDIVETLNYSETYLNKNFKEVVGTTFNEYLNRYRIQKSIELLISNTEMSIQEIAWSCGIDDYKYFGKVFKKYIGYSPKEYLFKIT